MAQYELPQNFFFGAAMSGPQTEGGWNTGGKLENLWDTWSNEDISSFYNRVGSYVGNDFMHHYKEDLALLKDLGLDSYRTSIQWSRLIDQDGNINPEGAAWYHELFRASREAGLEVFVNLYHFDMPTYLFRRGGWQNREVCEAYANYAAKAFEEFGQEIRYWFTFNEPIVEPEQRYWHGVWYPRHHNFQEACEVQYNISIAHALAVSRYRELYRAGKIREDARIGMICNFSPSYTKDDPSEADLEALRMNDGLTNRWWLDLVTRGKLPADVIKTLVDDLGIVLPQRPYDEAVLAGGVVDWIGCNYYQPSRVQAPSKTHDEWGNPLFAEPYIWPERVMNESRGWEIYPKGIYDFGMKCKNEYPELEWFVSENGIGIEREYLNKDPETQQVMDDYRIDFVRDHLTWVARAIADGARCVGYHYWGLIDNWSWANAFKNRYGFVEVDLMENYERRPKKSATWLKQVAETHVVA
ncbi:glycoside hydrolase family 1 protein [Collinsella sp. An268]|uniref:glycoside hydrolase family 1 protein n=1 Tax=Collinsella sp. An268 TaxID=1965612 RepID=UPI000B37F515|nr:glycoside hydrolase family 1 protein [Collinsella sp. An268]OUO64043.1 glycoside hydrolase [Collinsella sp. An268]